MTVLSLQQACNSSWRISMRALAGQEGRGRGEGGGGGEWEGGRERRASCESVVA